MINTDTGRLHIGNDEYLLYPDKTENCLDLYGKWAKLRLTQNDAQKIISVINYYFLNDEYLENKFGKPKKIPTPDKTVCNCGETECRCYPH